MRTFHFLIFQIFFFILSNFFIVAFADDVQILSRGNTFSSFEDYADFKSPHPVRIPLVREKSVLVPCFVIHLGLRDMAFSRVLQEPPYIPDDNVAGITPSMTEIRRDLHRPELPARPVYSRDGLVAELEQAARGSTGPLLVVGDRSRLKVMSLKEKGALTDRGAEK